MPSATRPGQDPAPRASSEPAAPLTPNQERLWFLHRLDPSSVSYNLPWTLDLRGALDVEAMSHTLDAIVERHTTLRCRFVETGDAVEIQPMVAKPLDLVAEPLADGQSLDAALTAEAAIPFDLAVGPPVRFRLLRIADDHHVLTWTAHHIVYDLSSYTVMLAEIEALYPRLAAGSTDPSSALEPLDPTFADFTRRSRRQAEAGGSEAALDHWRKALGGFEPLELPLDRPRPAIATRPAHVVVRRVDSELADAVRALARAEGRSTVFAPMLATFYLMLRSLSGQNDLVVGVPTAGRTADVRPLVGFFVDMLALRVDLADDPSFRSLIQRSQDSFLDARKFPHPPIDQLAAELSEHRRSGENAFFTTAFQLAREPRSPSIPGLQTRQGRLRPANAKFDIRMDVYERPDHLSLEIELDCEILDPATVDRWLAAYIRLLEQALETPDVPISRLDPITPADLDTIRRANRTRTDFGGEVAMVDRVRRHIATTPNDTAIVDGSRRWTWAALDNHASHLARRLADAGVRPGDVVGLCAHRCAELPAGMLAILATGAAYAPLDPEYPDDRLRFMIEDTRLRVLLVHSALRDRLPRVDGVTTILLDDTDGLEIESTPRAPGDPPKLPAADGIDGDFPACLIYTSGSTGVPKASVIAQRGLVRCVRETSYWPFSNADIVAHAASPSFDAATFEIWAALLAGGTLVVVRQDDLLDPERLDRLLRTEKVTVLFLTTAYFQQVTRHRPQTFEALGCVLFGGERCDPDAVRRAADACRDAGTALFHCYGPSECSVFSTVGQVHDVADGAPSVSIGGPMSNTTARVVDPDGRQVPIGVPGELWVGGPGLAHGYHDRPAMTAERFVPDAFAGEPGARLYRTGDRVRWLPDGTLDFLGRVDHQVKLRGFRIEPGEIEAALEQRADVGSALVLVREDVPGDRRLVGYVDPGAGERPDADAVRRDLAAEMPAYMVPAAIVVLDAFPLTANGKIDRRALPAPELESSTEFRAPETEVEGIVAELWAEALGVDRVGLDDNLFALGGHSLIAVRLIAQLRERLGVDLPVRAIFENPRLVDTARRVQELLDAGDAADASDPAADAALAAAIVEARERGALSFAQRRLWFLAQFEPDSIAYNLPRAFELHGQVDVTALERAATEVVRRHEILRTRYLDVGGPGAGGEPRTVVDPPVAVRLAVEPVPTAADLDPAIAAESDTPFDLEREVLRWRLFEPQDGTAPVLLVHVHHIAFDGWSVGLLRRELIALHDALVADPDVDPSRVLDAPPLQYADYAARQVARLADDRLAASIEPWRARLAGLEPLELPADHPRSSHDQPRAAMFRTVLPSTALAGARDLARRRGRTLFTTLLAAFTATVQALTGRDDIALGVPDAGRDEADLQTLMGFFVDMLVLRTDLSGDPDFEALIDRVQDTLSDARAHAGVPFDKLVEELRPEREPGRNPFFQVAFQVIEDGLLESAGAASTGLRLVDRPVDQAEAKFDLSVAMAGQADGLAIEVTYAADRFEPTTIERWFATFGQLLDQVIAAPSRPLRHLDLLTPSDRAAIDAANQRAIPAAEHPGDASLFDLVRAQAVADGDRPAIVHRDRRVSRRELVATAEGLARQLIARGVRPGDFVGLCVGRGPRWVEGMLGILGAGAAYVPLDADYPEDRLRFMIEDAGLDVLITESDRVGTLPPVDGVALLDLDTLEAVDSRDALPSVDGDFPAHMIFTSGSSGQPKGTVIPQRGVTRLVIGAGATQVHADDVVAQVASPSFDACTWEVWSALLPGATLAIVDRDELLDPDALAATFERHGVTAALITTAYFQQVARQAPRALAQLRIGLFGGERCDPEAIRQAIAATRDGGPDGTGSRLFNAYGPTECTVMGSAQEVAELADDAVSVPIGPPIPHTSAHVVDALGREVGLGIAGELWLGGPGVALGYHQRPAMTAGVFVPDPFGDTPGARCYRTGDLVGWLDDGSLDYLGRIDQQVKLRGFRIEPGEIEATLGRHPEVADSAVLVREDAPGNPMLVAYATPRGDAAPHGEALKAFLTAELPEFMVPAVVLVLDELPMTPNGKVDRRALPAPSLDDLAAYRRPESPIEIRLAELWAEVLGGERIGLDDDFFSLGGHSLLAVRLASRVRDEWSVEMAVRTLFEHPTLGALAELVAERVRAAEPVAETDPAVLATIAEARSRGVLSFAQQRLWFLSRLEPESTAYNMPLAMRLDGVDRQALAAALSEIVRRHEVLRCRYVLHQQAGAPDEPRAVIEPPAPVDLDAITHMVESAEVLDAALHAEATTPFDLERGALRLHLFVGSEDFETAPVLLFHVHHIAFDGWSLGVLKRELTTLHDALVATPDADPAAILPPLGLQYGDHAARQSLELTDERLAPAIEAWRQRLAGLEPLDLPADRRATHTASPAASIHRRLSPELSRAARDLARGRGRTLFASLLAVFASTLHGLTGRHDFAVGVPEAGRDERHLDGLMGFFIDMLVLRLDLAGDPDVATLIERVHQTLLDARRHAAVPLEKLVATLQPERQATRNPFFQVAFQVIERGLISGRGDRVEAVDGADGAGGAGGLIVEDLPVALAEAKFDLILDIVDHGDHLVLDATYAAASFEPATVERWLDRFEQQLAQATADAAHRLSSIDLLTPADRRLIADTHRAANAGLDDAFPGDVALIDQVRAHAATTPEKIAVRHRDVEISWGRLVESAEALGRRLVDRGIRPGDFVGLCVERGPRWVEGVLGILAAGAAYVPLDPDYPEDRLRFMIADAGLPLILTDGARGSDLPSVPGVGRLDLDAPADAVDPEVPLPTVDGDFPAYVIFTSGSTGKPKGTVIPQRGVSRLIVDSQVVDHRPEDVVAQLASPSFDASAWELWSALLHGATLAIVDRDDLLDPRTLAATFERHGVDVTLITTAYFQQLVRQLPDAIRRLRLVLFGGERCDPQAIRVAAEVAADGGPTLFNAYGPTECTVAGTLQRVEQVAEDCVSIPIGPPITRTTARVVDALGREVGVGVPGELWLGGPGVAIGYHRRAALTAGAFVPDPVSTTPGARCYRTGDLVCWLADGSLDYLGRIDHQVKLRGFRIELGEVEAQLARHPFVAETVALVREDAPGQARLVAYATPAPDMHRPKADDLIDFLNEELPDFMVPSVIVVLDRLPLTPVGKVDRRALPAPDLGDGPVHRPPVTATETRLAGLWGELLGVERVGLDDDFFALGGHSLLAVSLISRVRDHFEVELPMRVLFEQSTVGELAAAIDAAADSETGRDADPLTDAERQAILAARDRGEVSFGQRRLWFLERLEPDSAAYSMPFALRLRGDLDRQALERALSVLVERHEILRTRYVDHDGEPRAVVDPAAEITLEPLALDSEDELDAWLADAARRPFDLANGTVIRCHLLRRAEDDHVLSLNVHHIAFDGWSYGLLRGELSRLYEAFVGGQRPAVPAEAIQYADHAARQHVLLRGERLDRLVDHWRHALAGLEPLDLPADRPRPEWLESPAASLSATLPAELSATVRELARRQGTTLFTTLLAGFDVLLHALTGRDDFAVGVPDAGRHRTELEGVLGFFVDNLVLRADLAGDPSFAEVVERVQSTILDAREHADVPFEKLVEALQPERHVGRNPFFDVSFQVLDAQPPARLGALDVEERTTHPGTAKFDLTLDLVDPGDGPLRVEVEWAAQLFDRATVERWLAIFEGILAQVAADPQRRLSTLDVLAPGDAAVIDLGQRRDPSYDPTASLAGLTASAAAAHPDALAATYADGELTYLELDRRARLLAAALGDRGVAIGERVGICLPRSVEWPAAILGIGYAGAAYVPLDPDYPLERLVAMVEDAGVRRLVGVGDTAATLAARLATGDSKSDSSPLIPLGPSGWQRLDEQHQPLGTLGDPPPVPVDGDFPVYVIFTSGSTGRPKGVVVPHRGVVAAVLDPLYEKGPDDVMTQGTSPSFDAAAWEMWSTLTTGGTLVGLERDDLLDLDRLRARLDATGVNCLELPAPVFTEIARVDPAMTARARFTTTGGERCEPSAARAVVAAGGRPINVYGPTETSINATAYPIDEVAADAVSIPIGRSSRNAVLRVLDRLGRPVPVGVAGELCVGGPVLADGYLGRAAQTAEAFVPDPFAGSDDSPAGARLYRTGDRVRWLASGNLDFLGRIDDQVKIRGFRIEPGEIEGVLGQHPEAADVAMLARPGSDGRPRLLAWATPAEALDDAARHHLGDRLRAHLAEQLPSHMVPAVVQVLEVMPRTPVGKIDRRALPDPDPASFEHVAPRTATERALAEIWADVLDVEEPGVTTTFFELGGHSLLATRLIARIRDQLGVELPVRTVFEKSTIAEMAPTVADARRVDADDDPALAAEIERLKAAGALSFGQQRLWFLSQLEPESTAYNMPLLLRLRGPLDVDALERAMREVFERHAILRTRYVEADGTPRAVVEAVPDRLLQVDEAADEAAVQALVTAEAGRPFDLGCGPVARPRLIRRADAVTDDHLLLFHVHHIAYDGWSHDLVLGELAARYTALAADSAADSAADGAAELPEPSLSYADYAARQVATMTGDRLAQVLDAWRERLAGLEPLALPIDRPRPTWPTYAAGTARHVLPTELSSALRAYGRRHGRTLFATLLAGFESLLHRLTGSVDLAVGVPDAGRPRTELEALVGFFVDMLVVRADLADDPSFDQLAERLQDALLDAREHADVPFEKLVEELAPERETGRAPIFQVSFQVIQAKPLGTFGPLAIEEVESTLEHAKFDLSVGALDHGDAIEIQLLYAAELFDAPTIERWLDLLTRLLSRAMDDPQRRLSSLDALPAGDAEVFALGTSHDAGVDVSATLVSRFAERAAERGAAPVATYPDGSLSYRELDQRARRLAATLIAAGVRPGDRIGSAFGRTIDLLVSMVGIGYAGAAYVPLDPDYPAERLAAMIEDAEVRRVVARGTGAILPESVERIDLDALADQPIANLPDGHGPLVEVDGDSAAYVLFTSGSTGRPKGVVVPHRAVLNMLADPRNGLAPDGVMAQLASPSFDVSGREIWLALTRGARLVGVERDDLLDPRRLRRRFEAGGVTQAHLPAAVFHEIAAHDPELLALPRQLVVGGDRVDPTAVRRALARGARIVQSYGPTEVAIDATFHPVDALDDDAVAVPIGRGVPNVDLHVLDRHGRRVPVGAEGELHLGGAGLAHGYIGRPALTAAAFVPDPFADQPGARLYRTGDRVRWLASGELEFAGRIDQQVKIRGHRIEPGEIEAQLAEHPGVAQAVVAARPDAAGQLRLIAWIETAPVEPTTTATPTTQDALRDHLAARLPAYMLPAAISVLDVLPRTASGKIDRRALPDPEIDTSAEYVAPRDEAEAALQAIWADVLGVAEPSVTDSFFELGGHSLLATRLIARVRDRLAVELPVRAVFEQPTIAEMAPLLSTGEVVRDDDPELTAAIEAARASGALSFGQRRLWFLSRLEPESVAYNLPFPSRLAGPLHHGALERALSAIVERHAVLRTRFVADADGEPSSVVDDATAVRLTVEDLTGFTDPHGEADRRVADELRQPFDLEAGPVVRWRLWRLDADDHLLLGHAHHIAFDGTSHAVFRAELAALYEAFRHDRVSPLAAPPIQYADHAARQTVLLDGERSTTSIEHWRQHLAGLEPLELPLDRARPAWPENTGAVIVRPLAKDLAAATRSLARDRDQTLFTVLLAAYDVLLHKLTGVVDLAVGVPDAGRPSQDLEALIGFFVDMLVLRTDLGGDPTFAELIDRVRATLLDAREHADVPFEKLVEALQPERHTGRSPFFQTAFQVQVGDAAETRFGHLRVDEWPIGGSTAKFDLNIAIGDDGEELTIGVEYAAELFDATTIERWLDSFERLLEQAVGDPNRRLSTLSATTADDRERLAATNAVASDFPAELSLFEQFRAQAEALGDAPAVVHGDLSVSWHDLRHRAEDLGRDLVAGGLQPGDRVGLCVERGIDLVVGTLGILAAGGAYVPLDTDYPEDRLQLMVEDTEMQALVATTTMAARLPGLGGVTQFTVPRPDGPVPDVELPRVDGDFPGIVIYTSGSTGRPKGVVLAQRGVTRLVIGANYYDAGPEQVVPQMASPSFDATTWELWVVLLGGGTLVVIDREILLAPDRLAAALEDHRVTDFFITTAYFQQLVREAPQALRRVRTVLFGGERCDPVTVREAAAICRDAGTRLLHMYGPSECTTYATGGLVESVPEDAASVPIGGPVSNTTVYVVDPAGNPVPVGVPGELWLGGPGVADGYLRRPALTAGVFVPDPFSGRAGARCYRTGDLVRLLPDGQLDILGRIDHQVKLRGFRIEPGEIEATLAADPAVAASFVMVREDRPGDRRLVAYATLQGDADPSIDGAALRDALADELPDFMVPAVVVVLDAMPINPNGKVDRRALPEPEFGGEAEHRPPDTPLARFLAGVFTEVLGVEPVGLDDDFFSLGGHSLLAVKVFSRIKAMTEVDLPLTLIFDHPTLDGLSTAVERRLLDTPAGQLALDLLAELDSLSADEADAMLDG